MPSLEAMIVIRAVQNFFKIWMITVGTRTINVSTNSLQRAKEIRTLKNEAT